MSEEVSLDIAMSKEEMNKIKTLLTSTPGLRHYGFELKNGEYLDLVEYKDYEALEKQKNQLKEIIEEVREYLKSIENEPDADMYIKIGEYKEYKHLLQILDKARENK